MATPQTTDVVNAPAISALGETKQVLNERKTLHEWFAQHQGHIVDKWPHYFDIYERHFAAARAAATPEKPVVIYEIGVWNGGSMEMWLDYFGSDRCEIYGIDIDIKCKAMEAYSPRIHIVTGDQSDPVFLKRVVDTLPRPDIILDDGGHQMVQQIVTMQHLFPHLKQGGVFACEDTHTSYWASHGGGLKSATSYIETVKGIVDSMHSFHCPAVKADYFSQWCAGMHVYDSIVVLDKRLAPKTCPTSVRRGKIAL